MRGLKGQIWGGWARDGGHSSKQRSPVQSTETLKGKIKEKPEPTSLLWRIEKERKGPRGSDAE